MTGEVKTEGWTIAINDWPSFDIVNARPGERGTHSDEWLNGVYPTRLAAIEQVIDDFERARAKLSEQIARAKRMRNRATTRCAPTLGHKGGNRNGGQ